MPRGPMCCHGPPIWVIKGESSSLPPADFSVHCRADEGARAEGHRQFEAWCWEVKQRWGGCWRAGWLDPEAVHSPEPKWKTQISLCCFSSPSDDGPFNHNRVYIPEMFPCLLQGNKTSFPIPPFQPDHPVENETEPYVFNGSLYNEQMLKKRFCAKVTGRSVFLNVIGQGFVMSS